MRTAGSFEYADDAEMIVFNTVTTRPQTTNSITNTIKKAFFEKLHHGTTQRMLEKLKTDGKIKGSKIGRYYLWNL